MTLTLVVGGTRSGKSARAEALAAASGQPVRYVATADATDESLRARIAEHAARRPAGWTTVELGAEHPSLARALGGDDGTCVLIDGLGPWLGALLHRLDGGAREAALGDLDAVLAAARAGREVLVVAEEAGHGLLPPDAVSRAWLDLLGEAVQRLSAAADRVELVVAGRSVVLGGPVAADIAALRRDAGRYPDERAATAGLAALHGRAPEEIVPTNGAAEALWLLGAALRPALAACVHPSFTEGEAALRAHGVPVARILRRAEDGFALDPAAVPAGADLVLVGNPASPTGTLDPASALLALRRPGRVLVVDEAFMDLVPGEPASLVREALEDVIVVRSLTKSLGIPGLRAGYAVARPALAARLRNVRPPWSANALALAALAAAAQRPEALAAAAERATAERADLERGLGTIAGLRTWPAGANFCLVAVPDGPRVVAALRERGIAVRPAASFPGLGPEHLRLTARGPAENARLVSALAEAVAACA